MTVLDRTQDRALWFEIKRIKRELSALGVIAKFVRDNSLIVDHDDLQNNGSNTHDQIDGHISSVNNPHVVTVDQAVTAQSGAVTSNIEWDGDMDFDGEVGGTIYPITWSFSGGGVGVVLPQYGTVDGNITTGTAGVPVPAGSIVGMFCQTVISGFSTGGDLNAQVRVDDAFQFSAVQTVSGNGAVSWSNTPARDTHAVTANQLLQPRLTSSGGLSCNISAGFGCVLIYRD